MKIKTIGLGATKNIGNYNNLRAYFEAELDSDDSLDESIDSLRKLLASELDLSDEFSDLRNEIRKKKLELADLTSSLDVARTNLEIATNKWNNLLEYFAVSHPDIGSFITNVAIAPQINFDEIDDDNDEIESLPFEPRPFEVDEPLPGYEF